MDNPRAEKVAVVEEVREHFEGADAAILTEYRGLKVKELADLRRSLRSSGGEYKIYKNTLVTLAAVGSKGPAQSGQFLDFEPAVLGQDGRVGTFEVLPHFLDDSHLLGSRVIQWSPP